MARRDALIRFYFRVDPDTLNDETWANYYESIMYTLKLTGILQDKE